MYLAIDTSTPQMGLALVEDGHPIAEFYWQSNTMHTVELAPAVTQILDKTGKQLGDLDGIGIAIGPGSFTSLRVGLSFVKGFAFSRRLPVAAINSLDILAAAINKQDNLPLLCSLPAGRGRHACGTYVFNGRKKWVPSAPPRIATAQQLAEEVSEPHLFCGDMSASERDMLKKNQNLTLFDPVFCIRRPAILGWLAERKIRKGLADDLFSLAPLYLHIANPIPDTP